ncbi:hypothetical protein M422DRAFT_256248 [Sphaerobolus stellatus SS14]|uniref:Uncharacterized protein n=1 Tax=Sphaerobolus stellatus (strain SS14) TaxID=990650 RepID=A0A0C9V180_SPHS4|nr:hypothetical protein M422DRAFT_256248 [Sphaerobolus stellatus SS14]
MSLATADILPEHVYENILQLICRSGKKGAVKEAAKGLFPQTSNGNEQAHQDINRAGVKLSLLAGTMTRHEHNALAMTSMDLSEEHGVQMNDQLSTHFRRALRSLNRSEAYEYCKRQGACENTQKLKRAFTEGEDTEWSLKKLKSIEIQYSGLLSGIKQLQDKSTGEVAMPDLKQTHRLIDWSSFTTLPIGHSISQALPPQASRDYPFNHPSRCPTGSSAHCAPAYQPSYLSQFPPQYPSHYSLHASSTSDGPIEDCQHRYSAEHINRDDGNTVIISIYID